MAKMQTATLTVEQMAELSVALDGCSSVELKATVIDRDQRTTMQALEMDALDAEIRQVVYFDTPDLALNRHGVIMRARRTIDGDDTVVKLRPVVPKDLPVELVSKPGFGVEVDAMPGAFVCSASMGSKRGRGKVARVMSGERRIHSLFSKQQRAFLEDCAPEGTTIDDLAVLGPVTALKLKFSPTGYPGKLVAELWFYPDGSRILELSTKCSPTDAFEVAARTRAFLQARGVDLTGEQQAKTATALAFFSQELAGQ